MRKILFLRLILSLFVIIAAQSISISAQQSGATRSNSSDTIMILPFENTSNLPAYNWVGESFAEALTDLFARLETRGAGLRIVSNDERKIVQQKMRLPLTALPSLATSIKLAQQSRASLLVLGKYSVTPAQGEVATTLRVTARVVRVQDGSFIGETLRDGRVVMREIDLADAIAKLQTLQGQVAHQILYQREGNSLSLSQNEVVEMSKRVPTRAFEAYVKGMLTPETDELRVNYLKNALRLYGDEKNGETYPQAALELGHFYLRQNNYQTAEEYFSKLKPSDPYYAEAAFYAGLMQWNLSNEELALNTFRQLSDTTRLATAYNNLGAIAMQFAKQNKNGEAKIELLNEGLKYLQQAANSAPEDVVSKFNYGYALFVTKHYQDAAKTLAEVVKQDARDGQAYFLLAKALEKNSEASAAAVQDNEARRYLATYAKTQTEWQKTQTTNDIPFRLYKTFSRSDYLNLTRQQDALTQNNSSENELQNILQKARESYRAGRDDEALSELRSLLVKDSMNAESYLLIGNIHLRRGDLEAAVSNLKTAIFWKHDLIDGHIALGKIFLERSDFNQATTYCKNALQLDPNNQEAIALCRQAERRVQ